LVRILPVLFSFSFLSPDLNTLSALLCNISSLYRSMTARGQLFTPGGSTRRMVLYNLINAYV
jgi:hypothetical protein